jgi:hypothetical protein
MRTNPTKTAAIIATIGIDIGKTTFHLVGLDKRGAIVSQQKVSRCLVRHGGVLGRAPHWPAAREART